MADALKRILTISKEVASALVVGEAKNPTAAAFYRKFGFIPFTDNPKKLFLPLRSIGAADR